MEYFFAILHLTDQMLMQQMATHTKTIIQMTITYLHFMIHPIEGEKMLRLRYRNHYTEINTKNGPKSSNSAKCNEEHSNDNRDNKPKGTSIPHEYIKNEWLVYFF